jgi:5-methylcytosine-specific restriction endonuclease McrA
MARKETPKIQEVLLEIGTTYKTNQYGDVEIIDFKNSKKIIIRFADTGNVQTVQKDALEKGLIQDVLQRKLIADALKREEANRKQRELEAYKKQKELELATKLKEQLAEKNKIEVMVIALEKAKVERAIKEKLKFLHKSFSHPVYGEYVVIDACTEEPLKYNLKIKFTKTGHDAESNMASVKSGRVVDKSKEGVLALKAHKSIAQAERYQQNRGYLLAKAKDWQKNNPEKSRVRNRNRRARKSSLEGRSTYEEVQQLLISQDCKCAVCKDPLDDSKHLDHIIPITLKGGTGYISNLQWLCQYCSISKNAKTPELWAAVLANDKWWEVKASRSRITIPEASK